MRVIKQEEITKAVKSLYIDENYHVREDYKNALKKAYDREVSPLAKNVLQVMLENYEIASNEKMPMCQDTGLPVFFVLLGNEIYIEGDLNDAINEGVRQAVKEGFLRASMVKSPINRVNTKDNTPAIIHVEFVKGRDLVMHVFAKGGGSENKSKLYMLTPNDGEEGVKRVVLDAVRTAGPEACPPFVVGIGMGASFDKCASFAKQALIREIGSENPDPTLDRIEKDLEVEINKLGIGPQGIGGSTTCVGVFIESFPCHIASLPVAVNIQCNANRHKWIKI